VALARSFAEAQAGTLARERLQRISDELQDRINEVDTVELEITSMRRRENITPRRARPPEIWAQQGDQYWPFDGEYWEDELPHYRQRVVNRCGR
jgi:hypothetical protein